MTTEQREQCDRLFRCPKCKGELARFLLAKDSECPAQYRPKTPHATWAALWERHLEHRQLN